MQKQLSAQKRCVTIYYRFVLFSCLMLFLFSGCTDVALTGSSPSATSSKATHLRHLLPTSGAEGSTNDAALLAKAQSIVQRMTLDQKLGQLVIVEYIGDSYVDSGLQEMITQQYVGGFMYQEVNHNFDPPYNVPSMVNTFSDQAQKDAKVPLLIATDQEGGLVNRLSIFHGPLPSAEDMSATGDPNVALTQGSQSAKWMREMGINADLAPVVDVHTVDPPVLTGRMFGRDPKTVVTYAGAFLKGLQNNGVAGCLKHFPGLGAISSDPHDGLPTVNRSKADLESIDLAPYKTMIPQDHPAMIMTTDVLIPAVDPTLPAELSPKAIDGVLRGELGYKGVVITDGLYMGGVSQRWSLSQASLLSILAGNDLIEGPFTVDQVASVLAAFKQAVKDGSLSVSRIDQSIQRILLMKMGYGLIK